MSGAIREVDELNVDLSASTVVPAEPADTEPAPAPELSDAQSIVAEVEVGLIGADELALEPECDCPHAATGEHYNECGGAFGPWKRGRHSIAPAGIVRIPGEELFEAIESEEDIVKANRELLEGREQTVAETEQWTRLYNEVLQEANKRLATKGIVLLAAACEPRGLGAVLTGVDKAAMEAAGRGFMVPSEDYTVTISLPAKERVDLMAAGRESFVRWLIDLVVGECIEQQRAYRAVARMH